MCIPKVGGQWWWRQKQRFLKIILTKEKVFNTFEHFQLVQQELIAEIVNAALEKSAKWIKVQRDNSVDVLRSLFCFNGFVFSFYEHLLHLNDGYSWVLSKMFI